MADAKISQLPLATTPLAGTELVPIVQSATTKQTTVNAFASSPGIVSSSDVGTAPNQIPLNQYLGTLAYQDSNAVSISGGAINAAVIGGTTPAAGTFTTLNTTGNTTLGDATTDAVTVSGRMGIAGRAVQADELVSIGGTPSSGTTQTALNGAVTTTSAATSKARALVGTVTLPDSAFTCANVISIEAQNASKGASATITNQHGLYINDQTQGTNNFGITSLVSSGANKWNIYASGTAANYFAGVVGVGTNTPTQARFVVSNNTASLDTAFINAAINDTGRGLVISANTRTTADNAIATFESINRANATTLATTVAGNVGIGGKVNPASGAATLCIFNGTAPTGSVADGIVLYAEDVTSSSELKVRDEAGNVTTLSPHNFSLIPEGPSEDMAWAYYSEKDGKRINVDMLKLARMVEKLTGEKLVYED